MPDRPLAITNRHPGLRVDRRTLRKAIATLDADHENFRAGCPPGELSIVFLTDAALAQLHGTFLDDPTTTDVITFEGNAEAGFAGEICVSVDTASDYARKHGRGFAEELTLYVVHGWLHLAGYDDLHPAKKRLMRRAEARAMRLLQTSRCVPTFRLERKSKARRK